ncbi:hypothetical protein [Methanopyrus sp.]
MVKRVLQCALLTAIICTAVGLQPAHSEKAPIPKPPKLEEEKKEEKKEVTGGKEGKRPTLKPGRYRIAKVDLKNRVVYLKPLYKPRPVIPVKVSPRVVRKLRTGTVVEVHRRGSSTVIRTAGGTTGGSTVVARVESPPGTSAGYTGSSGETPSFQTGPTSSPSSTPSHPSGGAGTYGGSAVKVKGKTAPSGGGKAARSSEAKGGGGERGKKGKSGGAKGTERTATYGQKNPGSSNMELQREARSGSSGWVPYLVAIALIGAVTGSMWLVKQRRSATWEWE